MMLPTIHRNGTSKAELMKQATDALAALRRAIDAMVAMGPNGRDYYPQGPDAIKAAIVEHCTRVGSLVMVQKEIEAIAVGIDADGWKAEDAQ